MEQSVGILTDDWDGLRGSDVEAGTPVWFVGRAVKVLFDNLLSSGESVASAHGEIMADRMSDRQRAAESARWDGLTFHTEDGIIIFIQWIAVLPLKIRLLHPHSFILPHTKINVPRIRYSRNGAYHETQGSGEETQQIRHQDIPFNHQRR
jgi:hypothetical protein